MSTWVAFRFQADKFVNAVAFLAGRCPGTTKLKICKLLYFADRDHLRRFGRPIVGDHYYKLPHGPIPTRGLDILRGLGSPVEKALLDQHVSIVRVEIRPKRNPDLKVFSKSDIEILQTTCESYGKLTAGQLRRLSHAEPAWLQAEENGPMDYSQFFGDSDEEQAMKRLVEAEQESRDAVQAFNVGR